MARLIDRNGWEKTDDTIHDAAEIVAVRSALMPPTSLFENSTARIEDTIRETLFHRTTWRHEDGQHEVIYFEEPERAQAVMHGRTTRSRERLVLEARRAREACVLALRLVEAGGELLLGPEIEAGEITDHDAASAVARVVERLRVEASWVAPEQAERLLRAAGIPRPA